jgi:hypothetical protein
MAEREEQRAPAEEEPLLGGPGDGRSCWESMQEEDVALIRVQLASRRSRFITTS